MLKRFLDENFISVICAVAGAFVLSGFAWAFFALRNAGPHLILHFNDINGITSVGGFGMIVFMAALGLLVVGMDFAIAREFAVRSRFFSRFLALIALLFAVLLFIAFAVIINVNV